jgi:hypothetical protein
MLSFFSGYKVQDLPVIENKNIADGFFRNVLPVMLFI